VTAFPPPPFIVATGYEQHDTPDPRQCTAVSITVKYDGRLAGKIQDAAGRPLPSVPVHARPSEMSTSIAEATTDSAGGYELQGLPPGRYIVGVNINRPPSVEAPYQALFSPGTSIESKAVPIALAAGQHKQVPTLTMPAALRNAALRGCIVMPDRRPATEAVVGIEWARDGLPGSRSEPVALDARGCFAVVAHEGNRYGLSASLYLAGGVFLHAEHSGTIAGESAPLSLTLETPGRRR
jgi:Carboxypeptidase regulatory-like domain